MRARSRATALATVLLVAGCTTGEATWSPPIERGFPPAPLQQAPRPAQDGTGEAPTPIADLAHPGWIESTAARTEIPARALTAYAGAALALARHEPECGIGWNTLAGIGAVESLHGRYGGASADDDGLVTPAIIGIPLDGGEGVMEIPDTDGGELDGDTEWDRAVGPMQFIPTTWQQYAQDGDLDGRADPHQLDDAVLTAAHYLCDRGGELTTDDGWQDALAAYNRSAPYAREVAGLATSYVE